MTELSKYINGYVDVPAGDLGLGAREISFMYGKHKQLNNQFTKVVTGKAIQFWGSLIRKETKGWGKISDFAEKFNYKFDTNKKT